MMPRLSTTLFLASLMAGSIAPAADTKRINEVLAKAAGGDPRAPVSFSVRDRDGKGINRDYPEAMRWGRLAFPMGMADPGVIIDKVVISTGAPKDTYLESPESY